MEEVLNKLKTIKHQFLFNFMNENYIDDSYLFINNLPDEYLNKIIKDQIYLTIIKLYEHNHKITSNNIYKSISLKNKKNTEKKSNKETEKKSKEEEYIKMISNFMKEKEEQIEKKKEIEKICNEAMKKYYHEELYEFIDILYSNTLITDKILNSKSQSFKNLLKFEKNVIDFFNKEVNDKEGYTQVKGSELNFASRITGKTVTFRFEKEIEINLINFLSIIYEVNYYKKWYPFCSVSETLFQPGKAKKCVYMVVEIPIISNRDFLVYGFGVNRIKECGKVLVLCRGIQEKSDIFYREYKQVENKKYIRGDILIFGFEMKIINISKIVVRGLINVDPKIGFIPQKIINTVSEKFACDLFKKMINIVKVYEGSPYQNKNPSKIDKEFYDFIKDEVKLHFDN